MGEHLLILGGIGSWLIAGLHVAIPILGRDAYLACGGYWLIPLLDAGSPLPALLSLAIATIFFIWSAFAFSGAGFLRKLPLLRTGLILISTLYILRGCEVIRDIVFLIQGNPDGLRLALFSGVSLAMGLLYLPGTILEWRKWRPASE